MLISCTAQLMCTFVFAYANSRFSHDTAKISLKVSLHDCILSRVMSKPAFCICENKDADQLRGFREADLCLFRYMDTAIPLLNLSFQPSSVAAQPGLCRNWSETPKTGFLTTRLLYKESKLIGASPRETLLFGYLT